MTVESLEVTQFFMRPSLDVPWFQDTLPESHYEYIRTKYSGKVKGVIEQIADGTVLSISFTFSDLEARQEFIEDEYLKERVAQRDLYNKEHNIEQIG